MEAAVGRRGPVFVLREGESVEAFDPGDAPMVVYRPDRGATDRHVAQVQAALRTSLKRDVVVLREGDTLEARDPGIGVSLEMVSPAAEEMRAVLSTEAGRAFVAALERPVAALDEETAKIVDEEMGRILASLTSRLARDTWAHAEAEHRERLAVVVRKHLVAGLRVGDGALIDIADAVEDAFEIGRAHV